MDRPTVEVDWEHEVPVDEVQEFRSTRAAELEAHFGVPVDQLSDHDIARYMVKITHPSPRYLKTGLQNLVFN